MNYPGDCGTPTVNLLTVKLLLNSIVSTINAASRRFPLEMLNAVLDEDTGDLMEYRALMKNPKYSNCMGNRTPKSSADWHKGSQEK